MISTKINIGYTQVTYRALQQGTFLGALVRSVVESFGRGENGCTWSTDKYEEKLGISPSTLRRKMNLLKTDEDFSVGRIGRRTSEVRYLCELQNEKHITVLNWFNTEEFLFVFKDKPGDIMKNAISRRLKPSEVVILSYIYTHWKNEGYCEASYVDMANRLGCHKNNSGHGYAVETVCRDIYNLRATGLVKRIKTGRNGVKNRFTIDSKIFRKYHKKHRKNEQEKDVETAPAMQLSLAAGKGQPFPVEYYEQLQEERREKAEKYRMQVYKAVPAFEKVHSALEKLGLDVIENARQNRAEPALYALLLKKRHELEKERDALVQSMNIDLARFSPDYYGSKQCDLCKGKGKVAPGIYCDCWQRYRRRKE